VQVGKVNKITTTSSGAQVELGLDPTYMEKYPLYTDATVLIRPKSLLGEKYVDTNRGHSNVPIPNFGSLSASQAYTQVEVDQVLNNSDEKTRKALSDNIISLGQGTKDRGVDFNATIPELRAIAEHLTPVSARFKDRTAQIDHILVDTDILLTTLTDEHAQVAQLLQSADSVTGTIAQNDTHLAAILNHGGNTFQELNAAVGQQNNDANIRTSTEMLPPVLSKLNQFLALTNSDLNTIVPSLLLGQQYTYPNDQLTVAYQPGLLMGKEWDSGFRWYDTGVNGYHGFGAIGLMCGNDPPGTMDGAHICPGNNPTSPSDFHQGSAAPAGSVTPTATRSSGSDANPGLQTAVLGYLLGQ
jgi:phospholipid/cholesterol/gamma-HCH transport system substrate-binding protein